MQPIESTFTMPGGHAFASLHTSLPLDQHVELHVSYDTTRDSIGLHLGKLYLSLTREQWLTLQAAVEGVLIPQAVSA